MNLIIYKIVYILYKLNNKRKVLIVCWENENF